MSNSLRQENAPSGVDKDQGGQSTLGTQAVPWKDIHTVDLNVQRNVTIQGNLSVTGNTSTVEVQELHTEEPMIRVAKINTSDLVDIGVYGATNTEADGSGGVNTLYHGFIRDADDGVWKLFEGNTSSESNGTISLDSNTEGTIRAKLDLPNAGDLKIASTPVTSTAAELNKLNAVTDGTVSASKALVVDTNKDLAGINDLALTGNLTATTVNANLVGDVTGNADTASILETTRTLSISGDASGSATFNGGANADIEITIGQDAVENSMIANPGLSFGDGVVTPSLHELGKSVVIQGTSNETEVSVSQDAAGPVFTVGLPSSVSGLTSVQATGFTGALTGNADTASALETARTISLSGDVAGSVSFDGSGNVDIDSTIQPSQVENTMLANNGFDIHVDGTLQERVQLGEKLDFNGTASQVSVVYSAADNDLTFSLPSTVNVDTSGNAATATAQETARNFSISSSEITASAVSYDATGDVVLAPALVDGSVANTKLQNDGITFGNGTTSSEVDLGASLTIQPTSGETTVSYGAGVFQVGLPSTVVADLQGNASTATAQQTARDFSIGNGPVRAAAVSYDATGDVVLTSTIADDQITNAMLANDKLVVSVDSTDYDRPLGSTLGFSATNLDLSYSASTNEVEYGLPAIIGSDTTGNAATATTLETSRTLSVSGDIVGSVSFNGSADADIAATIQAGAVDNSMLANSSITFTDGTASDVTSLGETIKIEGTANEVEVALDANTSTFTVGLPSAITASLTGNADSATVLETARDFSISSSEISAAAISFDGSGAVQLQPSIVTGSIANSKLANSAIGLKLNGVVQEDISLGESIDFVPGQDIDLVYNATANSLTVSLEPTIDSDSTGNSATATALETARTLSVSGDASGSVSFDGTADADIAVTVDSVDLDSLQIASETQEVSTLVDGDLFIVKDADGSNSKMPASVIKSYVRDEAITAGTGVDIASGVVSIGQEVETTSDVTFNSVALGTATIAEADALKIDSITAGTGAANKALVLDASSNITSGLNSLKATTLTDGTASISGGSATGLTSLTSGNVTISGDEVFSNNHLVLNAGAGQVQIASGDKIVLQGNGGDIDISGDANFSRSVFYAVPAIKTSAHIVADGDHILMFDLTSAGGNQSITLGNSGQNINTNRVIVVKNIGTLNSVDFVSVSQIDGAAASSTVLAPGEKITLIGTPSNGWQSI